MGINLKVTPAILQSKATEVSNEIGDIERAFRGMESMVKAAKGHWTGDSSEKHEKYFKEIQPDMQEVIKRLKEHPTDLLKMAGLYEKGEKATTDIAGVLPDNVIE